jgi:hypothetical protein
MLMWGIAYQAFNAVFPAFYAELFPTRLRVTGCAVPTSLGVAVTGFLPSVMTTVAPPGGNVPIIVGYIALGCVALAVVAIATVRETSAPSAALAGSGTARHDGIFISYRRSDKPEFTRRLYDFLETHLGAERVFMDIRSIGPGEDFVRAIENRLRQMHGHVRRYRSELDERGR